MMPDSATPSSTWEFLVCPECLGELRADGVRAGGPQRLCCEGCGAAYPMWVGIPDFRPVRTPDACWEEDRILPALAERYESTDAEGLLATLLDCIDGKTAAERETLRRYYMGELAERARHRRALVEHLHERAGRRSDYSSVLEIGCGTGATLFELARGGRAVGVDPNLLHLIIARKRAEELGLDARLVCAFAEALPLRSNAFSLVNFMHTYEHFSDQERGLAEIRRVLAEGGAISFDVPNRFSLWREPHTKRWGIGFLPRRLTELRRIRNRTIWGLSSAVQKEFGDDFAVYTMLVRFDVPGYRSGRVIEAAVRVLRAAEKAPLVGSCLRTFQPGFEVIGWKPSPAGNL